MEATEQNMNENSTLNKDSTLATDASVSDENGGGELLRLLRRSLDMTVNKCVSRETVQRLFFKNYPELAKKHRKSLDGIHKQYVEKLDLIIRDEIAVMFEEEGLEALLDELEQLSKSSDQGQVVWRPSGIAKDDIRTHLMIVKLKQRAKLEQILKEETEEGERLQEVLATKRRHLQKTHAKCQHSVEQLEQAVAGLPADGFETFLTKHHRQNNNQP